MIFFPRRGNATETGPFFRCKANEHKAAHHNKENAMMNPIALIVPGLVAATLASAQPASPSDAPLRGPDLKEPIAPPPHFAPGGPRGEGMPRGKMFNAMHKAIEELASPETPESLRLTEAQGESLAILREEMKMKFELGERPLRGERPMSRVMEILTEEQFAHVRASVRETMGDARGPRGQRGENEGARRGQRFGADGPARFAPEDAQMVRAYRELSPEAKERVRAFIKQEMELQEKRGGANL